MEASQNNRAITRTSRQALLKCSSVDLSTLPALQRILLTTDGTLTEMLEAYFLEPVQLVKLSERVFTASDSFPLLHVQPNDALVERRILLRNAARDDNLVYAESLIVVRELDDALYDGLMRSMIPMGQLWADHRLETFKEIVDIGREAAGDIGAFFAIDQATSLLTRTYRVFSQHRPILMITEKFPEHFAFDGDC